MTAILLVTGFLALLVGGELLVRGAVGVAQRFGMSPMFIGLTLVGFGTSTPELVTSVEAALKGSPGIAVGNVVGSNICNVLLILGIAALLSPITVRTADLRRDGLVLALATAAALVAIQWGAVSRLVGTGFVLALVAYIGLALSQGRVDPADEASSAPPMKAWLGVGFFVGGLVLVILGAGWLVDGAIRLARSAGVSEAVIGLTVVAVGTSLPELVTSVLAAVRRHADVALGNIIGSNIYNLLGILGITAVIHPLEVPAEIIALDGWVMAAATALLIVVAATGLRVSRREGAVLLTLYLGYLAYLGVVSTGA